jgi:prolyl oligopeptidase PreP (S9A serine peptidase family)
MMTEAKSTKASLDSRRFSLGEIGININEVPEYQVQREHSWMKRGSIISVS